MSRPIENDNTLTKVVESDLLPGRYLFNLDCADGSSASVALFRRIRESVNDRPVASGGVAVALVAADSAREVVVGSEDIVLLRTGDTDNITVEITRIPLS